MLDAIGKISKIEKNLLFGTTCNRKQIADNESNACIAQAAPRHAD